MTSKKLDRHPLAVCFKILEGMGGVGKSIWKVGKDIVDRDERLEYLRNAIAWVRTKSQEDGWEQVPVDFRTFIESEDYLDRKGGLWPEVMRCGQELNNGTYVEAVLTGGIGVGKCFGKGTMILMFDGTVKAAEDIVIGDLVMGPDSNPRRVSSLARGREEMFRVSQNGAEPYIVNRSHTLSLQYTDTGGRYGFNKGDVRNISVENYLRLPERHRQLLKGWMPEVTHFGGQWVHEPYLLGLWLGDGDSDRPMFTTMDPEIVEELRAAAKRHHLLLIDQRDDQNSRAIRYRLVHDNHRMVCNPVLEWLRAMNLLGNKHIPLAYLRAPVGDRLQLLAGIMDTDGHLTVNGCYEIIQKRKAVADGVCFLARSCGFRVSRRDKLVGGVVYYRLTISGHLDRIPVRIARKKAVPRRCIKAVTRWGISVESLGEGDYYGFSVEGPDRLFLLGDFTVTHNSHLAIYTQAYQLYVLTCMRDPHGAFDLDPASNIVIVFQSINKDLAKDVDYAAFRTLIDESPFFKAHAPYDRERQSDMRFKVKKIVVKPVSGADTAAIGQNVIGGILDEVNFMAIVEKSKQSRDGGLHDQAVKNYNSIARRRESRFMQLGNLPGMLCLVSSRNYPGQFTDKKEEEARKQIEVTGKTRIYIYDKRSWEVRPWLFCGEVFRVFVGDDTRKPRLLTEGEVMPAEDEHLVMGVPAEYRSQFEIDLLPSLRDIAGVATQAMHPFMHSTDLVTACFGVVESIASQEACDFVTSKIKLYPKRVVNREWQRFAHVDLALTRDSAGVSVGHVPGFIDVQRGSDLIETLPIVQFDMILEVRPPRGGEIQIEDIRRLLYTIRDKLRVPLKWVTFDQFQSKDSMQIMQREGFVTGYCSMDTDTFAYDVTKQAFYDGRIRAPKHAKAQHEMITLEFNPKDRKIDHPPHSCFTGETRVALANGTNPTFRELCDLYDPEEVFYVYTMGPEGIRVAPARYPRVTKQAKELVEVTLDNYQVIRCTPEHLFMTIQGEWVQAQNLTPDISIMPLYRSRAYKGGWADYERVWCPVREQRIMTHHLSYGAPVPEGFHIHHKDENKGNNDPRNLELLDHADHCRHHSTERWEERRQAMREGHAVYYENGGREKQRELMLRLQAEGKIKVGRGLCSIEGCEGLVDARGLCGKHYQAARRSKTPPERTSNQKNHRVLGVQLIAADEPVYDLTVPGTENFALSSGVFVHNSKDVSDSMAGVVRGLTIMRETWVRHGIPLRKMPESLTAAKLGKNDVSNREDPRRAA